MKHLFAALSLGVVLLACGTTPSECTASSAGFGSAPTVKVTYLAPVVVPAGNPCRARLDVIRTQAELVSAYAELGVGDPPVIDFTNDVVVARVSSEAAGIQWAVLDKGGIVVGLRGCTGAINGCAAAFYAAPGPVTGVESRTCDAVACGFPGGGG